MKKITSLILVFTLFCAKVPVLATEIGEAADPVIAQQETSSVVGEDIEIGDGEFKIVSIPSEETSPVVGEDIEIGEDEVKIVSIIEEDDKVVGEDIEIGDGEFKIVSLPSETQNTGIAGSKLNSSQIAIISALSALALIALGIIGWKKKLLNN
jgi:hypothetical protein